MSDILIGTSAHPDADVSLLKEAGIEWVRHDFPMPFEEHLYGPVSDRYRRAREQAEAWVSRGISVMGVTPGPGVATFEADESGRMRSVWHDAMPAWFGGAGSDRYLRNYQAICQWLAEDLRGIVSAWQIANELDIPQFAGPLSLRQASELIVHGARGLKAGDPSLFVGPNSGGAPAALFLYGRLYGAPGSPLDYCGVDQYYATWQPGGPESWDRRLAELWELTGAPLAINEWGFSSAGEVADQAERALGVPNCQLRKWHYTWGPGHTQEGQAEFIRRAFDAFVAHRDHLAGLIFYRWEDQERCWQCGRPDCPIETAWGLVDLQGRPKPSFRAFKEGVARLLKAQRAHGAPAECAGGTRGGG